MKCQQSWTRSTTVNQDMLFEVVQIFPFDLIRHVGSKEDECLDLLCMVCKHGSLEERQNSCPCQARRL
jgi:hypothetical protein